MGPARSRRLRALIVALGSAAIITAMVRSATPVTAQVAPPSPTESPSPSAEPSPSDTPSPTATPIPSDTPSPTTAPSPSASSATPTPSGGPSSPSPPPAPRVGPRAGGAVGALLTGADGRRHHRKRRSWKGWAPDPRWGTYGTEVLDPAAASVRRRGWSEQRIERTIYAPFLVEGPATWSDSWDAPRWVGGYHPHHGQDVLCRYGAPVLAVDAGTIRFGSDPLGGREVYLVRPDGSFWYYAHLASYAADLSDGDPVGIGRVIGSCGASGDATVPHVHFAYFTADGQAVDPMPALVGWLRMAERRLDGHRPRDLKVSPMPRAGWPTRSLERVLGPPQDAADRIGAVTPVGDQPAGGVAAAMGLLLFLGSFLQRKTVKGQVLRTPDRPVVRRLPARPRR